MNPRNVIGRWRNRTTRRASVLSVVGLAGLIGLGGISPVLASCYSVSTQGYATAGVPSSTNLGTPTYDAMAGQYIYDTATINQIANYNFVQAGYVTFDLYQGTPSNGTQVLTTSQIPVTTTAKGVDSETVSSLASTTPGYFEVPSTAPGGQTYTWLVTFVDTSEVINGAPLQFPVTEQVWVLPVTTVPAQASATPGEALSDTATVSNPVPAADFTGTPEVQFWLNGPEDSTCNASSAIFYSGLIPYSGPVTFTPSAQYPVTDPLSPAAPATTWNPTWDTAPGIYRWVVDYYYQDPTTGHNVLLEGQCNAEEVTITSPPPSQNTPSITTQLSASSAISPATVTDTATLGGASSGATGTITIRAYSGDSASACTSGNLVGSQTAAPTTDGDGAYTATFTGLTAGTYEFQATYAGDAGNSSAESVCGSEPLTVGTTPPPGPPTTPNTPSVTTVPSAGGPVGTVLSDTAQVTGIVNPAATDTVTFGLYSNSSCTTLVDNLGSASVMGPTTTNGVATWTASSPIPGYAPTIAATYYWGVTFNSVGDPANSSSSLICGEPVTITPASGTLGAHTPPPTPAGAVKAASTPTPNTGADLFLPGMLAAIALLMGGMLLLTGVRIRRNPTA